MDQNWGTFNNQENTDNTDHNQRNKNTEEADDWKSNLIQARDPLTKFFTTVKQSPVPQFLWIPDKG